MKIRFGKYGIIFYTYYCIPAPHAGVTYGPFVFIKPSKLDDRGLLEHELVHTRQFWNPRKWFWGVLKWEVEAYREQLKWYTDDRTEIFAGFIATRYGLDITIDEAIALLKA